MQNRFNCYIWLNSLSLVMLSAQLDLSFAEATLKPFWLSYYLFSFKALDAYL